MVLTEIQKFEIISKYNLGLSISKIANEMKINRRTVSIWSNRYNKNKNLNRKRGSGLNTQKVCIYTSTMFENNNNNEINEI